MQSDIFLNRLYKYSKERFNLIQFIPLCLIIAGFLGVSTQLYLKQEININLIFISSIVFLLFLLRLRIFDEFKDDDHDKKHYPNRPISRGLLSLNELGILLYPVIFLEFIFALYSGKLTLILFGVSFIYSLVMFKEFFISEWLREHFSIYIFLHEILVIPLFFYLCSINGFVFKYEHIFYFINLVVCASFFMFLLEIARKVRSKENEIASKDTYTAQYGILGASIILVIISIISKITLIINFELLKGGFLIISIISILSFLYLLFDIYIFCKNKTSHKAKKVFGSSIIFSFVNLLASIVLSII
ncbi:MAG: UbiA family prenyltransferase [Candidatus Pacebacteria bacterium]|nr:UbiA family prenyltransferase [Candidatus Paceibacterota bacterium]